ncbi:MAG: amino acid ABC transporter permease [Termitinemataceae bacterium]|nr:MAG: amino acid ABC transporter permease [Termitinemataceae bacterium]
MQRPFDPLYILHAFPLLLKYLPVTLYVMLLTVLLGSVAGAVLARLSLCKNRFASGVSKTFVTVMRCTPSIVLLFIIYYAVPIIAKALFEIDLNRAGKSFFVIAALTLLFAAESSELMRAAFLSVDKGQEEAALSLGLRPSKVFLRIVLPQAAVAALPPFCSALIALSKEGALAFTIGLVDMMGQGTLLIARAYGAYALETYIALAVLYWILTIIIEKTFLTIEHFLSKGKITVGGGSSLS